MSFILDALKKHEQKRHQSNVPDLLTDHTQEEKQPSKRPLWLYLILAALIINAAILTTFLRPWESGKSGLSQEIIITSKEEATATESQAETVPGSSQSPENALESTLATPSEINQIPPFETVKEPAKQVESPAIETSTTDSAEKINGKKESSASEAASLKEAMPPVIDSGEETTGKTSEALSPQDIEEPTTATGEHDEIISASPVKEKVHEEVISASGSGTTAFNDLPESIRHELPKISISGHIYSNNPSARMVNINGSIIRENEIAAPGLKVEEITDSGAILSYQGHRFFIKGF